MQCCTLVVAVLVHVRVRTRSGPAAVRWSALLYGGRCSRCQVVGWTGGVRTSLVDLPSDVYRSTHCCRAVPWRAQLVNPLYMRYPTTSHSLLETRPRASRFYCSIRFSTYGTSHDLAQLDSGLDSITMFTHVFTITYSCSGAARRLARSSVLGAAAAWCPRPVNSLAPNPMPSPRRGVLRVGGRRTGR